MRSGDMKIIVFGRVSERCYSLKSSTMTQFIKLDNYYFTL